MQQVTDFQQDVLDSEKPVLLKFTAEWCKPCKQMEPVLQTIQEQNPQITILDLDIDKMPSYVETYRVRGVPTMMIFVKGVPIATVVGLATMQQILEFLESNIGLSSLK